MQADTLSATVARRRRVAGAEMREAENPPGSESKAAQPPETTKRSESNPTLSAMTALRALSYRGRLG